jgi:hypothetical protein
MSKPHEQVRGENHFLAEMVFHCIMGIIANGRFPDTMKAVRKLFPRLGLESVAVCWAAHPHR